MFVQVLRQLRGGHIGRPSRDPPRRHVTIGQIRTRLAPADALSLGRRNSIQGPYGGSDVLFCGPDDLLAQRVELPAKLVRNYVAPSLYAAEATAATARPERNGFDAVQGPPTAWPIWLVDLASA